MSQELFIKQTREAFIGIQRGDTSFADKVYMAARQYVMSGIYVIPIEPNSKKLPPKDQGVSYGNATCSLDVIEEWFHPDTGRFKGYNIGIACGREQGVGAIDCDKHGHGDGVIKFEAMLKEHGIEHTGPIQLTPNNGKHYVYLWQENFTSSTGKIDAGIDTRGGDRGACRSHIVAFPSTVNGKQYVWYQWGPLTRVPKFIADKLGAAWKNPPERTKLELMADDDEAKKLTGVQIESLLKHIDPNVLSYEDWLKIGQAINTQIPDDAGLKLWDEWSKRGKRYKDKECYVRWHGFNPNGPVQAGSLVHFAKEGGWIPPDDWPKYDKMGQYVEEFNKEFALVKIGDEYRIVWDHHKKSIVKPPYEFFSPEAFATHTAERTVHVITNKGIKAVPISKIWLNHAAHRIYENGMDMLPNTNKPGVFNTWSGWAVEPEEGDVSLLITHITEVICNGSELHASFVLDWMADAIQDPTDPKGTAIVIKGIEGCGKGVFANGFGALFGFHYKHLMTDEPLVGRFNSYMADALLVFADEVLWGGNRKAAGRLKTLITDKYLSIERKGVDMTTYTNVMRLIIASNEDWIIPAGPESRRWCMLEASGARRADFGYFAKLKSFFDGNGTRHMLWYLMNRKITNNLRVAPETDALMIQRNMHASQDDLAMWFGHVLEMGIYEQWYDKGKCESINELSKITETSHRIAKADVMAHYIQWCDQYKKRVIPPYVFWNRLKKFGFDIKIRPVNDKGERYYAFVLSPAGTAIDLYNKSIGLIQEKSNE